MKYKNVNDGTIITKKDYSKHIIFPVNDFEDSTHILQTVTIPPQTKQRLHKHVKQTEVYYILDGETSIFINGKEYIARPGDAFIVEPEETHQLWNKSENIFTLIVFKINVIPEDDDTEWLEV